MAAWYAKEKRKSTRIAIRRRRPAEGRPADEWNEAGFRAPLRWSADPVFTFGVFQNKLSFKFRSGIYGVTGVILILFALIVYPVLGYVFGQKYPSSPTFGLPCPTTIFTFGLLLLTDRKCPVAILIIPLIWSVIGFTAALNFRILEDTGLLVSGLLAVPMLFIRNRNIKRCASNGLTKKIVS